jgi:hypothetical protein
MLKDTWCATAAYKNGSTEQLCMMPSAPLAVQTVAVVPLIQGLDQQQLLCSGQAGQQTDKYLVGLSCFPASSCQTCIEASMSLGTQIQQCITTDTTIISIPSCSSQSASLRVTLNLPPSRSLAAFDIRAKLYAGHISSVYRAVDRKSGITVGLKLYRRTMLNDMERHQIAREIWLHIQLNHPSIIALYAAWKDKDYIYLVLEWAPEVGDGWKDGPCACWNHWPSPPQRPALLCSLMLCRQLQRVMMSHHCASFLNGLHCCVA